MERRVEGGVVGKKYGEKPPEPKRADLIPGGLADSGPPWNVDLEQVARGIRVEREHTDNPELAREIAWDHLTEDPRYYSKLEKVEKAAASRVALRYLEADAHKKSVALMKFLSKFARKLGPGAGKHIYVVGGAVRDFVLDLPIKDVDVVVDAVNLGHDSEWVGDKLIQAVPARMNKTTNQWGVVLLKVLTPWVLDGLDMEGEEIEIANARTESYEEGGYKPTDVAPATIQDDVKRRELTYNTLLIRLMDLANGPDKKDILDLTGCGLKDLAEGRMQCPADPGKTFSDDPSRMIRVIKFALRYGHKLTPDTRAAIKRNAPKLKNVPSSHLAQMLAQIVLGERTWKPALEMMADLDLLEPVKKLLLTDKPFRSTMENYVQSQRMDMMFGLMDVGLPFQAPVKFLSPEEQTRVREITLGMEREDAWAFLGMLKNPGNAYGDKNFFLNLARKHGVEGRALSQFAPVVTAVGRGLLLDDPSLARNPAKFRDLVEGLVDARLPRTASSKTARTYSRIAMFDFDGTLFRSWEATPSWWKGTELDKGPYSFFVREESMAPPCVPEDPPSNYWISEAVQAAAKATRDPNTLSVVITGRVKSHQNRVKELLQQKGLKFDTHYFNPGMSAAKFKVAVLKALLAGHQLVSQIDIWENENITVYDSALRATSRALGHPLKITTHQIHENPQDLVCGPSDFNLPSQNTETGLGARLAAAWGPLLGSGEHRHESRPPRVSRTAAVTGDGTRVGLFFPLPKDLASQFPEKKEDSSPQHVTFLYIGKVPKEREQEFLGVLETAFIELEKPVRAALGGVDSFVSPQHKVVFSKIRFSKDLSRVRDRVKAALEDAGFEVADSFPLYVPHTTIEYLPDFTQEWRGEVPTGSWDFGSVELWGLSKKYEIPFGDKVVLQAPAPSSSIARVARINASREARRRLILDW